MFGVDTSRITEEDIRTKFNYLYKGYSYENKTRLLTDFIGDVPFVNWSKLYDRDWYINQYELRNTLVKKYFKNAPEKLLVIDVTKEKTTKKLCEFLDIPDELVRTMPHEHKT